MSDNNEKNSGPKPEVATKPSANQKKASFGALTPLTTAQIITLLVGSTHSNSSYGGY